MHRFWNIVIEPVLEAVHAKRIVEVGVFAGHGTRNLLDYCSRVGGFLDYIDPDPAPGLDVESFESEFGAISRFHRNTSLEALPHVVPPDAVLIDGDHNWYTVFHELEEVARVCENEAAPFPIVLLHDVGWPYGRRDMYYAPNRVPLEYRQPYARQGMVPGTLELVATGGLNPTLFNAIREGGARNGVLTAVEDFVRAREVGGLRLIPALFGLAILVPKHLAGTPELEREIARWDSPSGLKALLEFLEVERVAELCSAHQAFAEYEKDREQMLGQVHELADHVRAERAHGERLSGQVAHLNRTLDTERARLAEADRRAGELAELLAAERVRAAVLQGDVERILTSRTWRWTRPARVVGDRLLALGERWGRGPSLKESK